MKKITKPSVSVFAAPFPFSCKKEKKKPVSFSATGNLSGAFSAATEGTTILNKQDGKSRVSILTFNADTSNTCLKFDGRYTVTGDFFKNQYINTNEEKTLDILTTHNSPASMDGIFPSKMQMGQWVSSTYC